jgi:hypothetical protein
MLTIQMLFEAYGCDLRRVRLLRHTPKSGVPGIPPYQAWRDQRDLFERYQSTQPARERSFFDTDYWAGFVATPNRQTLFVGLYAIGLAEREIAAFTCPLTNVEQEAGRVDLYETVLVPASAQYVGKLFIDWAPEHAPGRNMRTATSSQSSSFVAMIMSRPIRGIRRFLCNCQRSQPCRHLGAPSSRRREASIF